MSEEITRGNPQRIPGEIRDGITKIISEGIPRQLPDGICGRISERILTEPLKESLNSTRILERSLEGIPERVSVKI